MDFNQIPLKKYVSNFMTKSVLHIRVTTSWLLVNLWWSKGILHLFSYKLLWFQCTNCMDNRIQSPCMLDPNYLCQVTAQIKWPGSFVKKMWTYKLKPYSVTPVSTWRQTQEAVRRSCHQRAPRFEQLWSSIVVTMVHHKGATIIPGVGLEELWNRYIPPRKWWKKY